MGNVFFRQGRMDVADTLYRQVKSYVMFWTILGYVFLELVTLMIYETGLLHFRIYKIGQSHSWIWYNWDTENDLQVEIIFCGSSFSLLKISSQKF